MPTICLPSRIIALEEHVSLPDMIWHISPAARQQSGWPADDDLNSPMQQTNKS